MIRAKVLSQEVVPGEYYDKRVYNLRILKTYKGAVGLNQTKDIRPHGSKQRSLFTKAYTSVDEKECGIIVNRGNGYETRQSSLLYVFVLFFGLDPAQNTIVVYSVLRN